MPREGELAWNDAAIRHLSLLWSEGHSTAEVARRMGVSKNAVVGKAHRIGLPSRPSPIRRSADGTPRAPEVKRVRSIELTTCSPADAPSTPARFVPAPKPVVEVAPPPRLGKQSCCWPIGDPGTKHFTFCDELACFGKPYCEQHAKLAYVKGSHPQDRAA